MQKRLLAGAGMALLSAISLQPVYAALIPVTADTYITIHPAPDKGGADANHGADTNLPSIFPGGFETYALIRFDAAPGTTFLSDGTLELYCYTDFSGGVSGMGLHTITQSWAENTVTWNSFGGAYSAGAFAQNNNAITPGNWVNWTIPRSVLQGWADNPATNYGILFKPTGGRDSDFYSRESTTGFVPRLNATVVPEPGAICLLGLGGAFLAVRRIRSRKR